MNELKEIIRNYIKEDIQNDIFKDKLEYTLLDENSKMLRSLITYSICKNEIYAVIVEYIHNSSLIIDDMPCMDNDNFRRNKEAAHIKFGENNALLLSSQLLIYAFKNINKCIIELKKNIINIINSEINEEISKLIKGQYLDINLLNIKNMPPRLQKKQIIKLMKYKTGSLFALSFLLGYIGKYKTIDEYNELYQIKNIGYSFGICFQIIDDLKDYNNIGENKLINIKTYFNNNEIIDLFSHHIDYFRNIAIDYKIYNVILNELYLLLIKSFKEYINK